MDEQSFETPKAPQPVGLYPHARKIGNLLFLSGMGPRLPETGEVPGLQMNEQGEVVDYDMAAQCKSVFANLKAVLEEAGSSWNKLVDVTVFLTNIPRDFDTYNALYAEYSKSTNPAAPR